MEGPSLVLTKAAFEAAPRSNKWELVAEAGIAYGCEVQVTTFLNQLTFVILCIDGSKLRAPLQLKERYLCPSLWIISPWVVQEVSPNLLPGYLTLVISLPFFTALPHPDFPGESTYKPNLPRKDKDAFLSCENKRGKSWTALFKREFVMISLHLQPKCVLTTRTLLSPSSMEELN